MMVAICHNPDVGDAWEWADSLRYPERETSLTYRIGINYILLTWHTDFPQSLNCRLDLRMLNNSPQ